MLERGLWVALEGPDGVGKTTTLEAVADQLSVARPDIEIVRTRHPGATPLGRHLRQLVKSPAEINPEIRLGSLSEQLLMIVDHINFKDLVLEPALARGAIILADRCDLISGLVYGMASGLSPLQLNSLFNLAARPRLDRLYVLTCPIELAKKRLIERQADRLDKFERLDGVMDIYRTLLSKSAQERLVLLNRIVALENVKYIDTCPSIEEVARSISADVLRLVAAS
jgi:dTMP kinase